MAIVDSVVIGSGRKKVGEVTLSIVHGRTIAKKYQGHVANPNTRQQQNQRNKMANVIVCYNAVKALIQRGWPRKKKYQSSYNAFTAANIAGMPVVRYENIYDIDVLPNTSIVVSKGNLPNISPNYNGSSMEITLGEAAGVIAAGDYVTVGLITSTGETMYANTIEVTREFASGDEPITIDSVPGVALYVAFWSLSDGSNCAESELIEV